MDFNKYKNKMPYDAMPIKPRYCDGLPDYCDYEKKLSVWREEIKLYREENNRLLEEFKKDAFAELGISDNPKKDILFELAWEYGHSDGYSEVWNYMVDLKELL